MLGCTDEERRDWREYAKGHLKCATRDPVAVPNEVSVIDTSSDRVLITVTADDGRWGIAIKP